nr:DNA gyrase subunit A [Schwartzia sp. (in: firmicutes)]
IVNLLPLSSDETITAVIPLKEFREDRYLFMATKKGIVKKTVVKEYDTARKGGLIAINLDEDDDLIGVRFTDGESRIILGTRDGQAVVFEEENVRSMGRQARGVMGIRLHDMDEVVGMDKLSADSEILTVTEQGYGKRTKAEEYRVTQRGGKGIINMKVTEKTGAVIGLKVARPDQELMLITTDGIVIRTTVGEISLISRNTQGVMLMKTEEGDRVASLAVMDTKNE